MYSVVWIAKVDNEKLFRAMLQCCKEIPGCDRFAQRDFSVAVTPGNFIQSKRYLKLSGR